MLVEEAGWAALFSQRLGRELSALRRAANVCSVKLGRRIIGRQDIRVGQRKPASKRAFGGKHFLATLRNVGSGEPIPRRVQWATGYGARVQVPIFQGFDSCWAASTVFRFRVAPAPLPGALLCSLPPFVQDQVFNHAKCGRAELLLTHLGL
jgi:hypothetical protein